MKILNKLSLVLLLAVSAGLSAAAQQPEDESAYVVKTIALHHLSATDAISLLTPYLIKRGGVYSAGPTLRAVSIRGTSKTIAEMEKLLAQYDRAPETVTLRFQLIAADYTSTRDPSLAGLDSVLRGVLKFTGYHRLSSMITTVDEKASSRITLSGDGDDYSVTYTLADVYGSGSDGSVHLQVSLRRLGMSALPNGTMVNDKTLLSTGLTIPDDHTVVLGGAIETAPARVANSSNITGGGVGSRIPPASGAPPGNGPDRALILTVTPQIAPWRHDDD